MTFQTKASTSSNDMACRNSVWEEKKRPQQGLTTVIGIWSPKLRDSQQQRELQTRKQMSVRDLTI
jgi:hypothetical protein